MNGIETLIDQPVLQALGWALLHFVWQGLLIGPAGEPVLVDIEAAMFFDVEWEHAFLELRFGELYPALAAAGISRAAAVVVTFADAAAAVRVLAQPGGMAWNVFGDRQLALARELHGSVAITAYQKPDQVARLLARSFYREMARAGFDSGQIVGAASEIIAQLNSSLSRGEELEGAHPQVAGRDAGQHGAGQFPFAIHRLAGGGHRQRTRRRDSECVHRLADQRFTQHGSDGGLAVAAAREGRAPRPLERDVAPLAVAVDHLAQQQRAAVAQLRHEADDQEQRHAHHRDGRVLATQVGARTLLESPA